MKVYAYSRTMAGAQRLARERQAQKPSAIILPFKSRPARPAVPLRIPSTDEVSKARHLSFLASVNIKPAKPEDLIKRVAAWHDLCYRDIITDIRFRHFVEARNDCIAAVRIAFPEYSLECLALTFSRTHVSVLNALRKRGLA